MADIRETAVFLSPRIFDLPDPAMTLDGMYSKLMTRSAAFQMPFFIRGGILGERIAFDAEKKLDVQINVHIRDGRAKITPVLSDSHTAVNGIDVGKNSILRKGIRGTAELPVLRGEYVERVTDTIRAILADQPVENYIAPEPEEMPDIEESRGRAVSLIRILCGKLTDKRNTPRRRKHTELQKA